LFDKTDFSAVDGVIGIFYLSVGLSSRLHEKFTGRFSGKGRGN